jgi:uncharacterized protein YkwD
MQLPRFFPLSVAKKGFYRALSLSLSVLFMAGTGFAKGNPKPAATRPVARLISVSRPAETPVRTRARLVAPAPMSNANNVSRVRAAVAVAASGEERRAFDLINAERRRRGQQPLIWDGELTYMARAHSQNMAQQNFFNHVDRNGRDISGRAHASGVHGWRALGENIAYNQGYDDPASFAVERWMTSSKHRENILNGQFTHAGLGVATAPDGRVFFTQVFMTR